MRLLRKIARNAATLARLSLRPSLAVRVLVIALRMDGVRADVGPREAVARARTLGLRAKRRGRRARARLRRVIIRVDALFPGGPNCYRRALVETALDRGAAEERIHFGLDVGRTGHAWLDSDPEREAFDVTFSV